MWQAGEVNHKQWWALQGERYDPNLGDPDTAGDWLDRAEEVAPFATEVILRRADNLQDRGRIDEYSSHVEAWLNREPDNAQAQRYAGYATVSLERTHD